MSLWVHIGGLHWWDPVGDLGLGFECLRVGFKVYGGLRVYTLFRFRRLGSYTSKRKVWGLKGPLTLPRDPLQ